jgi:4,4'-diaponeurosporenoate glycosyltransferase
VVVPAYNEERRIAPLLESLALQSRPADEVIVVDDRSTDATAVVARRLGARVRRAPAKPPGWIGKTWACWTGARESTGDLLVFLDADVWLAPDGLARLLAAREERGGLVSVQPFHETPSAAERLSAVCNVVIIGALGAFTPFSDPLAAGGSFGPCLVVSRADYRRSGGHAAVRDRIAENVALGDRARQRGLPVVGLGGRGTVSFRMYPDGLRSMMEGWCKSMASGAGDSPALSRWLMTGWLTGATAAVIILAVGIAALAAASPSLSTFGAAAVGLYLAYTAQMWWMFRRIGSFGLIAALLFPLPLAFFHTVFARSMWLTRRGGITWRGRAVGTGPRRASARRASD